MPQGGASQVGTVFLVARAFRPSVTCSLAQSAGVCSIFLGILEPEQMSPSPSYSKDQVLHKDLEAASAVPLTLRPHGKPCRKMRHYFSLHFKLLGGGPTVLNGPPSSIYFSHII